MAQIDVDPERLAEFAMALREYGDSLLEDLSRIDAKLGGLRDSWQDEDAVRVEEELRRGHAILRVHAEECLQIAFGLGKRAGALEAARNVR